MQLRKISMRTKEEIKRCTMALIERYSLPINLPSTLPSLRKHNKIMKKPESINQNNQLLC